MSVKFRRWMIGIVIIFSVLCLGLVGFARALPQRSFPQISGEVRVQGLDGRVEIVRDRQGIPHLYARSSHDLFFAQGYVHAQDRFWQMDFVRHVGAGRLRRCLALTS